MYKHIFFWNSNGKLLRNTQGSGGKFMRSMHPLNEIHTLSKLISVNITNNISNIRNSFIIFIKDDFTKNINVVKLAKKNNNIIIVDIIDWLDQNKLNNDNYDAPNLKINNYDKYIDAFICLNKFVQDEYKRIYNKPTYLVKHHFDPRLSKMSINNNDQKKLNILFNGYIGHKKRNCIHLDNLCKNNLVHNNDTQSQISLNMRPNIFNCHISIRDKNSWEYHHKPAIKMKTAAALNCNIITSNDISVQEILKIVGGLDYPYLLQSTDYDSILKMIKYAQDTYGTTVWFKGLEIMKKVKEHTSLNSIVINYYIPFFNNLFKDFCP